METRRAKRSVDFLPYGQRGGYSSLSIVAALAVIVLLGSIGWRLTEAFGQQHTTISEKATTDPAASDTPPSSTASSSDSLALGESATTTLGNLLMDDLTSKYVSLQDQGLFTPEVGQAVAAKMAQSLALPLTFKTYTIADVVTKSDISYKGMLAYRDDLKSSLAPLMKIDEPEYQIFAEYIETKDASYLRKLRDVAQDYRDAVELTLATKAPADATTYHTAILNAMSEFAATLDQMEASAEDPFAAAISLRSYNQAESDMLSAFGSLTTYEKNKRP